MDFRTAVIESLDRLIASDAITKIIDSTMEKTVAAIIQTEMRDYSDFGKMITEHIKKAIALNGEIDLPSYNDQILKILRRQVESYTRNTIEKQVAENMTKLLKPPPESITVTDLVEQYIEYLKAKQDAGCVCYGDEQEITFLYESENGFAHISLDDEPNKQRYKCDIRMGIVRDSGKIYHLCLENKEIEKEMFSGPFYEFERLLFQMKAAGTKIVIPDDFDPEDISLSYAVHVD